MDQFIACHAQAGHAIMLDCRSLNYRTLPLKSDVCLLISNTMVDHHLAGGEYNVRRAECEEGVRRLASVLPGIESLRDVSMAELDRHRWHDLPVEIKHASEVVTMDDSAAKAFRTKRDSSIRVASRLVRDGAARGFVSAAPCWMNFAAWTGCRARFMRKRAGFRTPSLKSSNGWAEFPLTGRLPKP